MKNQKSKTTPKPTTASELARQLGVTRQLIAAHRKRGRGPALDDVKGWKIFLSAVGREGSLPEELRGKIGEAKLRIYHAQADRAEDERQRRRGELVEFASVDQFVRELVGVKFFGELDKLAHESPSQLKGKTETEISATMGLAVERIADGLRAHLRCLSKVSPPEFQITEPDDASIAQRLAEDECRRRAVEARCEADWLEFSQWKQSSAAKNAKARSTWCASRAKAGLPVPNASDAELAQHSGLKRS